MKTISLAYPLKDLEDAVVELHTERASAVNTAPEEILPYIEERKRAEMIRKGLRVPTRIKRSPAMTRAYRDQSTLAAESRRTGIESLRTKLID